jgi:hypothetical protein
LIHPVPEREDNGMPQPNPTPDSGKIVKFTQLAQDHWLCIVLVLAAFILGLIAHRVFGL